MLHPLRCRQEHPGRGQHDPAGYKESLRHRPVPLVLVAVKNVVTEARNERAGQNLRRRPGQISGGADERRDPRHDLVERQFRGIEHCRPGRRRAVELGIDPATVLAEQAIRDERDRTREHSPLEPAPGAVVLDTTGMSLDEVVERIAHLVVP